MAVAFTEKEKDLIKEKLLISAEECIGRYGMRKTTVDELVKMAGISKGALYLFYPSKEVLFFEVFERLQEKVTGELLTMLGEEAQISRSQFTDAMVQLFGSAINHLLAQVMCSGELEYLMRKLPMELVEKHQLFDNRIAETLLSRVRFKKGISPELVSASFRAVFLCTIHKREIGEEYFDDAMSILIAGLASELVEE